MRSCLADLDGSRWRSAVFYYYQSGRRVSVALRKFLARDRGKNDRPERNSGEVFSEGFGVAGGPSSPLVGEDSLPQEPQAIGMAGLVRGEYDSPDKETPHLRFLTLS